MGKMYYTEEEAAERLGIGTEELTTYVRDAKLRVFQDGPKRMFRVDEVDSLAGEAGEGELELAPVEGDAVSLSEAEAAAPPTKEDTVITAEGISIFDDEDLEIEAADPMAKTQIAPSIEDQISLEGVGSGSGLLDLTRESDDTSLGAEVLDHIDLEGEAAAPAAAASVASVAGVIPEGVEMMAAPSYVEAIDASAGLFGGIIVGCAIVAALLGAVAISSFGSAAPGYVKALKGNLLLVLVVAVVIVIVGAVLGWVFGRASAARQAALRRMGA
jgi:hypothetical protein